jgi:hypothetical protein
MTNLRGIVSRVTSAVVVAGLVAGQLVSAASAAEPQPGDPNYRGHRGGGQPRQATPTPQARPTPPPQAARPAPPPQAARPAPPPTVFTRSAPPPVARSGPPPVFSAPPPRVQYEAPRRHDRDRRYDRGIAIGVGAAIIGATLGYRYYRGPNRESVYDRCDRNFPEFDYDTGTFTNEDGDREICPYLRPYID